MSRLAHNSGTIHTPMTWAKRSFVQLGDAYETTGISVTSEPSPPHSRVLRRDCGNDSGLIHFSTHTAIVLCDGDIWGNRIKHLVIRFEELRLQTQKDRLAIHTDWTSAALKVLRELRLLSGSYDRRRFRRMGRALWL